jgi:hypothetical protein
MVRHSYIDKQRRPGKLIVPRVAKYLEFIESTPIEAAGAAHTGVHWWQGSFKWPYRESKSGYSSMNSRS